MVRLRLRGEDRTTLESLGTKATGDMTVSNSFASVRSGGDALKQQDPRKDIWNAKSEAAKTKIDRHGVGQVEWIDDIQLCPVYHPTKEEFTDPLQYIQRIAGQASKYGMCKIVPPVVSSVPAGIVLTKERSGFKFYTRVQPMRLANWDENDKTTFPISQRAYSLHEYEKMANRMFAREFSTAASLPSKFVEAEFWKELVSGKIRNVEYACDVEGSAFSASSADPLAQSMWNLKKISKLPKSTLRLMETAIPGVTEPMLYIGMLFSMFAWHIEDHYLYSINYHHFGAPKTWYGVPGNAACDFEKVVQEHVYDSGMLKEVGNGAALDLLLGKTTMFAPKLLSEHGVPVFRAVQNPGEFVITFPRAYHAGFSHGFNCGEAVNFAMADWFPFGAAACSRYEFLNRVPLLPHEELLCKEALMISQTRGGSHLDRDQNKDHEKCVKVAFLLLMRFQHLVRSYLKQKGAREISCNITNVLCGRCKHACYISHVTCKCYPEPTCFNHGEIRDCVCGSERCVYLSNFKELQAAASKFEQEEEVLKEASKGHSMRDSFVVESWPIEETTKVRVVDPFDNVASSAGSAVSGTTGELQQQERLLMTQDKVSNIECKNSGSERPNCSNARSTIQSEASATLSSLGIKGGQEEESDTEEAFRVKRRRVLPTRSKRFQVDEQGMTPMKSEAVVSDVEKPPPSNRSSNDTEREETSAENHRILIRDIVHELGLKGSMTEIIAQWQNDAVSRGSPMKVKHVKIAGNTFEALSLQGCNCLKQLLSKDSASKLERLVQQSFAQRSSREAAAGSDGPLLNSRNSITQGQSEVKPVLLRFKDCNVGQKPAFGTGKLSSHEQHGKCEARKESGLDRKRQRLDSGNLQVDGLSGPTVAKKVVCEKRLSECGKATETENSRGKSLAKSGSLPGTSLTSKHPVASMENLSSGDAIKDNECPIRQQAQKVSYLKMKEPSGLTNIGSQEDPLVKRKSVGANSEKIVAENAQDFTDLNGRSEVPKGKMLRSSEADYLKQQKLVDTPVERDAGSPTYMEPSGSQNIRKTGGSLGSGAETNRHDNQKVEQSMELSLPRNIENLLQKEPLSGELDPIQRSEAKVETAWCPNQEALSSYAGHGGGSWSSPAGNSAYIPDEYYLDQGPACYSPTERPITSTDKHCSTSDMLADNLLEEGELREAVGNSSFSQQEELFPSSEVSHRGSRFTVVSELENNGNSGENYSCQRENAPPPNDSHRFRPNSMLDIQKSTSLQRALWQTDFPEKELSSACNTEGRYDGQRNELIGQIGHEFSSGLSASGAIESVGNYGNYSQEPGSEIVNADCDHAVSSGPDYYQKATLECRNGTDQGAEAGVQRSKTRPIGDGMPGEKWISSGRRRSEFPLLTSRSPPSVASSYRLPAMSRPRSFQQSHHHFRGDIYRESKYSRVPVCQTRDRRQFHNHMRRQQRSASHCHWTDVDTESTWSNVRTKGTFSRPTEYVPCNSSESQKYVQDEEYDPSKWSVDLLDYRRYSNMQPHFSSVWAGGNADFSRSAR